MPSSKKWKVTRIHEFDRRLKDLLKDVYRKDTKGREKFQAFFKYICEVLQYESLPSKPFIKGKLEPAPTKALSPGQQLAKLYFTLPRLKGAVAEGRIIYLIDNENNEIKLLHIYTHKDYKKRPPDELIRDLIKRA